MKTLKIQSREELKTEYRTYLNRQRGLADKTINHYISFVDRFLDFKFGDSPDDLSKITGPDIADFLQYSVFHLQTQYLYIPNQPASLPQHHVLG